MKRGIVILLLISILFISSCAELSFRNDPKLKLISFKNSIEEPVLSCFNSKTNVNLMEVKSCLDYSHKSFESMGRINSNLFENVLNSKFSLLNSCLKEVSNINKKELNCIIFDGESWRYAWTDFPTYYEEIWVDGPLGPGVEWDYCGNQCSSWTWEGGCGENCNNVQEMLRTRDCNSGWEHCGESECSWTSLCEQCGNEILQEEYGEECDDGNYDPHDGCYSNCKLNDPPPGSSLGREPTENAYTCIGDTDASYVDLPNPYDFDCSEDEYRCDEGYNLWQAGCIIGEGMDIEGYDWDLPGGIICDECWSVGDKYVLVERWCDGGVVYQDYQDCANMPDIEGLGISCPEASGDQYGYPSCTGVDLEYCGNDECGSGEMCGGVLANGDTVGCFVDCESCIGDGSCQDGTWPLPDYGETCYNSADDCGSCCGQGGCQESYGETLANCLEDCSGGNFDLYKHANFYGEDDFGCNPGSYTAYVYWGNGASISNAGCSWTFSETSSGCRVYATEGDVGSDDCAYAISNFGVVYKGVTLPDANGWCSNDFVYDNFRPFSSSPSGNTDAKCLLSNGNPSDLMGWGLNHIPAYLCARWDNSAGQLYGRWHECDEDSYGNSIYIPQDGRYWVCNTEWYYSSDPYCDAYRYYFDEYILSTSRIIGDIIGRNILDSEVLNFGKEETKNILEGLERMRIEKVEFGEEFREGCQYNPAQCTLNCVDGKTNYGLLCEKGIFNEEECKCILVS